MIIYNKSLSSDFNGKLDPGCLDEYIRMNSLQGLIGVSLFEDNVQIIFDHVLSSSNFDLLNQLISSYLFYPAVNSIKDIVFSENTPKNQDNCNKRYEKGTRWVNMETNDLYILENSITGNWIRVSRSRIFIYLSSFGSISSGNFVSQGNSNNSFILNSFLIPEDGIIRKILVSLRNQQRDDFVATLWKKTSNSSPINTPLTLSLNSSNSQGESIYNINVLKYDLISVNAIWSGLPLSDGLCITLEYITK